MKKESWVHRYLKPESLNLRHYFGGTAFLLLIVQLSTGLFMTMFYQPQLENAYKSVQHINNVVYGGGLIRNIHRWSAFLLVLGTIIHIVRSFVRKDFFNEKKRFLWLTGFLLFFIAISFVVTGLILPWEWRGYWVMEMVPNYFGVTHLVGNAVKQFLIDAYTIPRNYNLHILILPLISIILIDLHFLMNLRKRGIGKYLAKHALIAAPFFIAIIILAKLLPIPSEDPDIIPLPLEGKFIPGPEWFFVILLTPFMYLKGVMVPLFGVYMPFTIFTLLAFLPYYFKKKATAAASASKGFFASKGFKAGLVVAITVIIFGLIFLGSYQSPIYGCNACHNTYRGVRMGVPPPTFKDRKVNPILSDNEWMMRHWYYPDVTW